MAIVYLPARMLRRAAPKKMVEKLVTQKLNVNRAALTMLARSGVLSKTKIEKVALKVIRSYKKSYREELADGLGKADALDAAINDKVLMVQRVQNSIVHEIAQDIKEEYGGELYEWLPSDAEEPDPQHQLKYGERFRIGKGEMPGDRYGCRCGMRILVDETSLEL